MTTIRCSTLIGNIFFSGALCFAELGCLVPKSGAEYAYLMEAFAKKGKLGAIPAFVCSWVYVMILRPAEIAIIILTFAEYSIQPFHHILGLENLSQEQQSNIIKIFALLAIGEITKKYFDKPLNNVNTF